MKLKETFRKLVRKVWPLLFAPAVAAGFLWLYVKTGFEVGMVLGDKFAEWADHD